MADPDRESRPGRDERTTVLEVFGMKLSVKNRALAEVLTRDATDILGRERRAAAAAPPPLAREVVAEALPDVLLAPPSVRDEADDEVRAELKRRCDRVAESAGIRDAHACHWRFEDGLTVHVRVVARIVSAAAAADMIRKLKSAVLSTGSGPESVLFVTAEPQTSQVMRAAIDALDARCAFRSIDIGSLECLAAQCADSSHPAVLLASLLSPAASVAWPDLLAALRDLQRP